MTACHKNKLSSDGRNVFTDSKPSLLPVSINENSFLNLFVQLFIIRNFQETRDSRFGIWDSKFQTSTNTMGNAFEGISHEKQVQSSGEDHYLSKIESRELEHVYSRVLSQAKSDGLEKSVSTIFHCRNIPQFSKLIINRGVFRDFHSFQLHFIDCCRKSSSTSLENLWKILDDEQLLSQTHRCVLTAIYDMVLANKNDINEYMFSLEKQIKALESFVHAQRVGKVDDHRGITFQEFLNWSNDMAPYLPKVYLTYVQTICLPESTNSPTFKPFMSPRLLDPSSIVKDVDLLPFSFFSDKLQGNWKRLYTSEVDGCSFNRIVHHILGYDVSDPLSSFN